MKETREREERKDPSMEKIKKQNFINKTQRTVMSVLIAERNSGTVG